MGEGIIVSASSLWAIVVAFAVLGFLSLIVSLVARASARMGEQQNGLAGWSLAIGILSLISSTVLGILQIVLR